MDRAETALILKVLKIAYPAFYSKMPRSEMQDWLDVWSNQFRNDDAQLVTAAVNHIVEEHPGYPPGIADVKQVMKEIRRSVTGEPTDEEYWQILKKALEDGNWGANEQFNKLPEPLKRYCGSPSWIRDHAKMDLDVVDSVIHGQFLKQFPKIKEAQEFHDSLPEPLKQTLGKLFGRMPGEHQPDEFQINERKNLVFELLDGGKS